MTTTPPPRERFWNVPNTLSMSRLVLAVVVFGLIGWGFYLLAAVVFVLAAASDWLDGYFARKLGQVTAIGRQLDPLVDKVIVGGAYIHLLAVPPKVTGLWPWMVTTVIVRELIVQAVRSLVEGQGVAFGAKFAGKLKTTFQCISVTAILVLLAVPAPPALLWARDIATWGAVLLTVYSGIGYVRIAWPILAGGRPESSIPG